MCINFWGGILHSCATVLSVYSKQIVNTYNFFWIFLIFSDHKIQANLSVTSLPDLLFSGSNPTRRNIVEGSVIWFYCEVNSASSTLSVTWNKDGRELVQDIPHIILRNSTSTTFTTLVLVLDNVVSSDVGLYQCTAQDGLNMSSGTALTIRGY